jgi:AcrR family transcriptional regulator
MAGFRCGEGAILGQVDRPVYNEGMNIAASARDRLLDTAHRLFYGDGIRATGIDRVIAEARVTKVTFYRHFPSKDELVLAYLALRHDLWMAWWRDALRRHARRGPRAVVPALGEWFAGEGFRGCAFLNAVGELGATHPEIAAIARAHKDEMADEIASLLPAGAGRAAAARAIAMAIDGAIVRAQAEGEGGPALKVLGDIVDALALAPAAAPRAPRVPRVPRVPRRVTRAS